MDEDPNGRRHAPFFTTLPGILTGVAAVLTAAASIAGIVLGRGGGGNTATFTTGATSSGSGADKRPRVNRTSRAASARGFNIRFPSLPPEGVVTEAHWALAENGRPISSVISHPIKGLWASFTFGAFPTTPDLTIVWRLGDHTVGTTQKQAKWHLWTYVRSVNGALPKGLWRVRLIVADIIVKELAIRLR